MNPPVWLFDLDNTLHDANRHLMPRINRAMTAYVARVCGVDEDGAARLREHYWQRYGATLLGLMRHHGVDPDDFLQQTHRFADLAALVVHDAALGATLDRLPGGKLVYSNAPRHYAEGVLRAMGVRNAFAAVCAIEDSDFQPKPSMHGLRAVLRRRRLEPTRCVLVEDSAENLRTAKRLGMRTVLISARAQRPAWVDLRLKSVTELPRRLRALGL